MSKFTYLSQYQNLHMDRANPESMKTVNITFNTNLPNSNTPRLMYRYKHGYSYRPQMWGLWNIKYSADLGGSNRRAYGNVWHNTGAGLVHTIYYTVDTEYVSLYVLHNANGATFRTSGETITFTGYVFANDLTNQDYS